jgi:hypothetical protein
MADADRERQITYTKFRLAELRAQRDKLDAEIRNEETVLAKLYETMVE